MKIIEKEEVFQRLTMPVCIGLMAEAFRLLETGSAQQPVRAMTRFPQGEVFGFMPAYLGSTDYFGAKVVNAMPQNVGTGYPSHNGYVIVFESVHGQCVGLADAGAITQIRTGAVSAVATDLLARKDSRSLALIGAGAQARSHLEAILCVRPQIQQVWVYDIRPEAAQKFRTEMEAKEALINSARAGGRRFCLSRKFWKCGNTLCISHFQNCTDGAKDSPPSRRRIIQRFPKFPVSISVCTGVKEAVKDADIICTVTPSKEAYLQADWVKPGAHINAVGTFSPTTREVTSQLVRRSRLYADQIEAMKQESGEYLVPLQEGLITEEHIQGSIGQLLLGKAQGRTSDTDITLFDALGLAVEDVICGRYLCTER